MRSTMMAGAITGLALTGPALTGPAPWASTSPPSTSPPSTSPPSTDSAVDGPEAIISLSPTATEMLFAIGAGDQVIAVDPFSNFPAEAADKMTELSAFEPNVEAIAGIEPDLVITDGTNADLLEQLDSLGISHWEGLAAVTLDDSYEQIEQLGEVTGHESEAAAVVASMQHDIAEVLAGVPAPERPLTYYHELDDSYFSVTSDTFIGNVYAQFGLGNIADEAEGDAGPYPQLNAEFIISSDPDLIFLACTKYCTTTAESVAARPGWDTIAAVTNGNVVELDDDIASRWGPRVVDFMRVVADAVTAAAPPAAR
jgi:iron complex transport system substrate-binding protein